MELIDACVSLNAGILGVAYPVTLQVISRLDDKYKSAAIVGLFTKEEEPVKFRYVLVFSLIAILLWGLKLPVLVSCPILDFILPNSARNIVYLSSILVAVWFFKLIDKVMIYSVTIQIVRYMMKKNDECVNKDDLKYFNAINDLLLTSIREVNEPVVKVISEYVYDAFKNERVKQQGKPVEYPDDYYRLAYNILIELDAKPDPRFRYLAHRAAGGVWLLGEFDDSQVSALTYSWIWRLMRHAIEHGHEEYVTDLWEHADQFMDYSLEAIDSDYGVDATILNKEAVEKRNEERRVFKEFFMALGGFMLFSKKHDVIRRIFQHTRSTPPQYELLPQSVTELFEWYNWFADPSGRNLSWIESKYSLPGVGSMSDPGETKETIMRYIALLFLRQYTLHTYFVYQDHLSEPALPKTQGEKHNWLESLSFLQEQVRELYNDRELLSTVGLGFLDDAWCRKKHVPTPEELLERIKKSLEQGIETGLREQIPAKDKVDLFMNTGRTILVPALKEFQQLNNKQTITGETQSWYVKGMSQVMDKSSFVHNQEAENVNYHTFTASQLAEKLRTIKSEIFWQRKTKQYLIYKEQIREAIQKLGLSDERYVALSFGIDVQDFIQRQGGGFGNIKFHFFKDSISKTLGLCFFVMREADLPEVNYLAPNEDWDTKKELIELDKEFKLHGAVVDLNANKPLFDKLTLQAGGKDLTKSVITTLAFDVELKFKKAAFPCVYFRIVMPQRQQGMPNDLKDIEKFGKE